MSTTENNKLIVNFLGWDKKINKDGEETPFYNLPKKFNNPYGIKEYIPLEGFVFDNDWNWLMEVVEKIVNLKIFEEYDTILFYEMFNTLKIEVVYNACVTFIEWYNKQTAQENNKL